MIKENIIMMVYIAFIIWIIVLASSGSLAVVYFLITAVPLADKMAHFSLMGVLALLVNISLRYRTIRLWNISILLGSAIVLFFVVLEELSQNGNSHRTFDWYDLLADLAGIIVIPWLGRKYLQREENA